MEVFFLRYRKTQPQKIWQQNYHGPWNFIYFQPDACVQFKATCEFQLVEPVWVYSLLEFVGVTDGALVCGVSAQTARLCVSECVWMYVDIQLWLSIQFWSHCFGQVVSFDWKRNLRRSQCDKIRCIFKNRFCNHLHANAILDFQSMHSVSPTDHLIKSADV